MIPNSWLLGLGAGIALAAFTAGWTVQGWRCDAGQKDAVEQAAKEWQDRVIKANERAEEAESKLAAIDSHNREITKRYNRETRKDAYRCQLPVAGLGLLNAARTGADLPGEPTGTVP